MTLLPQRQTWSLSIDDKATAPCVKSYRYQRCLSNTKLKEIFWLVKPTVVSNTPFFWLHVTKEKSTEKTKPNQNKNKWQTPKKKFTLSLCEPVCRGCNLWSILQLSEGFFVSNCIFCGFSTASISVTQSEPSDPVYKEKQNITLNCSFRNTTLGDISLS